MSDFPEALDRDRWLHPIEESGSSWWQCLRPCPECRHRLHTNGRGSYRCPACGYKDRRRSPKRPSGKRKRWSKADHEYLREHYHSDGAAACAKELGKPVTSVRAYASQKGLTRKRSTRK